MFPRPAITIQIAVTGERKDALPPTPIFRGREHLVSVVADAHNYAVCDVKKGFAFAWLSQDAIADQL
ncbi:MAG: aldolase, partial [Acidobacteriaceae bacterium]